MIFYGSSIPNSTVDSDRTITDYCRLCYQARDNTGFLDCKRAQLGGYNSLLAGLTMERDPQFGDKLNYSKTRKKHAYQQSTQTKIATKKMRTHYSTLSNSTTKC